MMDPAGIHSITTVSPETDRGQATEGSDSQVRKDQGQMLRCQLRNSPAGQMHTMRRIQTEFLSPVARPGFPGYYNTAQ